MRRDTNAAIRRVGAFGVMMKNNRARRPKRQHDANHRGELHNRTHVQDRCSFESTP